MTIIRQILASLLLCGVAVAADVGDSLCPPESATHTAVRSGRWDDPATWDHGVPGVAARIHIAPEFVVKRHVDASVLWAHVAGTLETCEHCDTTFNVHTLYVPKGGHVHFGKPTMPCTGKVRLNVVGDALLPGDDLHLSLGLVCHGEFTACGLQKTAFGVLDGEVPEGATTLKLRDVPYRWQAGDQILLAGTDSSNAGRYQSEYLTVKSVNGRTVTFVEPTRYRHFQWRADLLVHVANLSRNVVIASASPTLHGHLMFMSSMNDIRDVLELNLGRTDKSRDVTDPRRDAVSLKMVEGSQANPRGRYADHNHKCGLEPSRRQRVVVRGSPGWGMVNHASNCEWDECIALECFGSGFVTEEGQERGHMRRCLAAMCHGMGDFLDAKGRPLSTDDDHGVAVNGDWGKDGAGFWLQGGMVEVSDCVSFDNSGRGFALFNRALNNYPIYGKTVQHIRYPIDVDGSLLPEEYGGIARTPSSTVPQRVFNRNTAYNCKVGLQAWSGSTTGDTGQTIWPATVRGSVTDFTTWGRGARFHIEYGRQLNIDGLKVIGDGIIRALGSDQSIKQQEALFLGLPEITVRNFDSSGMKVRMSGFDAAKNHVVQ